MTLLLEILLQEHNTIGKDLEKWFPEIKEGIDLEEIKGYQYIEQTKGIDLEERKGISIYWANFWEEHT